MLIPPRESRTPRPLRVPEGSRPGRGRSGTVTDIERRSGPDSAGPRVWSAGTLRMRMSGFERGSSRRPRGQRRRASTWPRRGGVERTSVFYREMPTKVDDHRSVSFDLSAGFMHCLRPGFDGRRRGPAGITNWRTLHPGLGLHKIHLGHLGNGAVQRGGESLCVA